MGANHVIKTAPAYKLLLGELVVVTPFVGKPSEMVARAAEHINKRIPWKERWPSLLGENGDGRIRIFLKKAEVLSGYLKLTYDCQDHGHRSIADANVGRIRG